MPLELLLTKFLYQNNLLSSKMRIKNPRMTSMALLKLARIPLPNTIKAVASINAATLYQFKENFSNLIRFKTNFYNILRYSNGIHNF